MTVSIIVPTYNERENITILVDRIHRTLSEKSIDYEIIVVDDNSPDGTAEEARRLAEKYNIKVLVREKRLGLTSAVYEGFKHASGDSIIVMDADLQHPPEIIPSLVYALRKCDIVIASRHVKGGGEIGFPLHRKIVSRGAILLARLLVPNARRVKDPVSGFFGIKRDLALSLEPIEPEGYKVLVEILAQAPRTTRICEVPYVFEARKKGVSKLGKKQIFAYLKLLWKTNRRFISLVLPLISIGLILLLLLLLRNYIVFSSL